MPPGHDETNVFKIPHGRMIQLVNACKSNLTVTDFADSDALIVLLTNIEGVLKEFKSHEEIENEFIMKKLKSKLKTLAIDNSAVCNCHTKDEFTPLFNLVDIGYTHINKTKTPSEKISFGVKLRKALNQFTERFLPHMKEEEEIFQPLLMQYFTEDELVEMKIVVIKSHLQQRKYSSKLSDIKKSQIVGINSFDNLPYELCLNIFSYLSKPEMLKAAQVCSKWNELMYDKSNWKFLDLNDWLGADGELNGAYLRSGFGTKDIEYIDDSDEEYEDETQIRQEEVKLLQFWIRMFLPRIGPYVHELRIRECKSLNNNLTRRILKLCPNLQTLDLSYTNISDNSFRGVKLDKLEKLSCEGCEKISDKAFKFLLSSSKARKACFEATKISHSQCINQMLTDSCTHETRDKQNNTRLNYINLSGCWSLTDSGLEYISSQYDLENLQYLNLSGCLNVSSFGMNKFVKVAKQLIGENLYYCDNIQDGPLQNTANGCENLECSSKFCCRKGS